MTAPAMLRSTCAAMLVAGLCLAALPGCGSSTPPQAAKKEEPAPNPNPNPNPNPTPVEPKSSLGPLEKAAEDMGTAFLKELGQGSVKAEMLSTGFLKAFGKPV